MKGFPVEQDIVQFNEKHRWVGCFGAIYSSKKLPNGKYQYHIWVPIPEKGTAYITAFENELEVVGDTDLVPIKIAEASDE